MLFVLGALFGLTFLSQKEIINNANDGFSYSKINIKYPTTSTFLEIDEDTTQTLQNLDDITNIVEPIEDEKKGEVIIKADNDVVAKDEKKAEKKDLASVPDLSKIDTTKIVRIKYPYENPELKDEFRKKLKGKKCRIIHYGDSQLEGDRISGYVRNRLQKMYGGNGPGFIPIKQVYDQISASVEPSANWTRHTIFGPKKDRFEHKKYGMFMTTSRFTAPVKNLDSIDIDSLKVVEAFITVSKSNRAYRKFRTFNNIGLHYGHCYHPVSITVTNDGKLISKDTLLTDGQYHNYKIRLPNTPTNLKITLSGKVSPDFYGLTLDGSSGVLLDNVAMRGASGTVFTRSDATTYRAMSKELDPEIIITQYGGNAVPYVKDSTGVDRYVRYMKSQLNWLKRSNKNASFLFIGPTDLSTAINGKMVTYKLLPYLNEELEKMCLENNIAYWNMYEAMGGKNTMPMWVEKKLAASDYTHFSPKGTKIISELFFIALYLDLMEGD